MEKFNRKARNMQSMEQSIAQRLYEVMPGAEQPPRDERGKLWGEVEHTREFQFCYQIASEIIRLARP
jgi:hypothetical protein